MNDEARRQARSDNYSEAARLAAASVTTRMSLVKPILWREAFAESDLDKIAEASRVRVVDPHEWRGRHVRWQGRYSPPGEPELARR